jgi:hypothetical protein
MLRKVSLLLTAFASLTMANLAHADSTAEYAGQDDHRPVNGANLRNVCPGYHKEDIRQNPAGSWSYHWKKDGQ